MSKINVSDEFYTQVVEHEKELAQLLFDRALRRFDMCISVKSKCWQEEEKFNSYRRSLYREDVEVAFKIAKGDFETILRLSPENVRDLYLETLHMASDKYLFAINDLRTHYDSLRLPFD